MRADIASLMALIVALGAACGGDAIPAGGPIDAPTIGRTVPAPALTAPLTSGTVVHTSGATRATLPTVITTPEGVVPDGVCNDPTATTVEYGPAGTFLRIEGDEQFEGVIQARPDVACPGDLVEFQVSVLNRSDSPLRFETTKGLLLHTGGPQKWLLDSVGGVEIEPGEVWSTTLTATIPPTRAGTHSLSAGWNVHGTIRILDPATARTP